MIFSSFTFPRYFFIDIFLRNAYGNIMHRRVYEITAFLKPNQKAHQRRCTYISKFFLCLFIFLPLCILLIIGLMLDTQKKESLRERRNLETFPFHFWTQSEQLEKYISDHLPYRSKLIDFYFESGLGRDLGTKNNIIGKENFVFMGQNSPRNLPTLPVYQNTYFFTPEQISLLQKNVQKIADFAKEHNIKVYLIIPPETLRVYHKWMPDYILRENKPSVTEQVETALKNIITVVPIEKHLISQARSQFPLIYKTDSHWSEDGAFESYKLLMEAIQKDFKDIRAVTPDDYHIELTKEVWLPYQNSQKPFFYNGSTYLKGLDYGETQYRHYIYKDKANLKINRDKQFRFSDYEKGSPHRAYIICDSFSYYMLPFLMPTFSHIGMRRYNESGTGIPWGIRWKEQEKELLNNKIDILILSISDQKLEELMRFFK